MSAKEYVLLFKSPILKTSVDPVEVGSYLNKLGNFTTKSLWQKAQDPKNPLHKYLTWDKDEALKKIQMMEVRHLVLSVGFKTDSGNIRTHESVVVSKFREYVPVEKISESGDLVDQVIRTAFNELVYWKAKHQRYKSFFGGIFDEIDKAGEMLRSNHEKESAGGRDRSGRVKADDSANKKGGRSRDNSRRQSIVG